ncbi:MAG TPA: RagB/SusD family nutrient uptake outer membrane protein [Gemmatimonadales bacterium]|nr:RagB/SusD family nutrient uptake outer membrane protein [Gemmatimonadales bacterium]
MRTRHFAIAAGLLALAACNFDITNDNQPTLDDLVKNPTRSKLSATATGLFAGARSGIQALIWRLGSMGREGINLSGNNQPDFIEPYFGPVVAGGSFGGTLWIDRYAHIRTVHIFLQALASNGTASLPATDQLSAAEVAGARGVANTLKALALLYVVETRDSLGAPVDVDRPVDAPPAPFVRQDSVYAYIIGVLNSAATDLAAGGSSFFFHVPPGFSAFATPATFLRFNRALAAKANVLRATDATGCAGNRAACYGAAITALGASFLNSAPATFQDGAYFDFSTGPGDQTNTLSDPLNALTFFALQDNRTDADTQPASGGAKDQRVLDKIAAAQDTQIALLGSIPIPGQLKFVLYFSNGQADASHPVPIIKNEELILLDAEAQWFAGGAGGKLQAIADLNNVRQNSGKLAATTVTAASPDAAFVTALMYERRFSLLWEQGTRWIDARRFSKLGDIPLDVPGGFVPPLMPVPKGECDARSLTATEVIPGVVTCKPPLT